VNLQIILRNASQLGDEARRIVEAAATVELTTSEVKRSLATAIERIMTPLLRSETPVRTGQLQKQTRSTVTPTGGGYVITWTSESYARYVIDGTKPHMIVATNARALRFETANGVVFRRSVQHPGTKPNPYPTRAWERAQPAINAALALAGETIAVSFRA